MVLNSKIVLYIFVSIIVVFAIDSININQFFKKNKVIQARVFLVLLTVSLIYLVTNFIYDFFVYSNIF